MSDIIDLITYVNRSSAQFRAEALEPFGLKSCHASYLTEICASPGISQDRLARRICINKSNVARQTAVLEEGGFIQRRVSDQDKRITELYPTEKTLELLPQIRQVLDGWRQDLTRDLSEAELEALEQLLIRMVRRARSRMEEL